MDLQINVCVAHCGKIPIFVQKNQSFLAGKFKFNVGVDFIKIEFFEQKVEILHQCAFKRRSCGMKMVLFFLLQYNLIIDKGYSVIVGIGCV